MFALENLNQSLSELGIKPSEGIFSQLHQAYTESGRYYHTNTHIADCLAHFQDVRNLANKPAEIEVALWFHDAIYITRRNDNEKMSAEWARTYLNSEGAEGETVQRIVDMIIATKAHDVLHGDVALLVDIDLVILGASETAFKAYDQAIRREYEWVSEEQYRTSRAQILNTFLEQDFIYKTIQFREKYEEQARKNLSQKIKELSA